MRASGRPFLTVPARKARLGVDTLCLTTMGIRCLVHRCGLAGVVTMRQRPGHVRLWWKGWCRWPGTNQ